MKHIAMLAAVVGTLNAGTVVHTITVNPTLTDWSVTNRVPQFDQRLGTLKSVQVTINANAAGRSEYVSLDRNWQLPVSLAVTNAVSARVGTLTASNSVTVSGASSVAYGVTNVETFAVSLGRAVSTNRNLGVFVGTNTLPVVTSATARTWYSGPGDFSLRWDTRASAVATVAYTFESNCDKDKDGDKDGDKDDDKDGGGR
jgi:hypothetical protein